MRKNYQAIIFDFDGVLFDSELIHLQACNHVFQSLGFSISEEEYFQRYIGLADVEMFELILDDQKIPHTSDQSKQLRLNKIAAYKNIINQSETLEGVGNVKNFLVTHSKIINQFAICSSATRAEIDATLNKLEYGTLKKYFKHIVSIDDLKAGKPSPEGYLLSTARLNVLPRDCLVIEDTAVGIAAAKKAGTDVVALTTTHSEDVLREADFIADDYQEIAAWLRSLGPAVEPRDDG